MSKFSDLRAKPSRRTQGQRRQRNTERRQKPISVTNCRRNNTSDRRFKSDRRPADHTLWQSLKTIKPVKHQFLILESKTYKGSLINISV